MKHIEVWLHECAQVICTKCGAKSRFAMVGQTISTPGTPSRYVSIEECEETVISLWNKRLA